MTESLRSNINFRSNLYERHGVLREDTAFLQAIHDPILLKTFKSKGLRLTAIQEKERLWSIPCRYSDPEEHLWGVRTDEFGNKHEVCMCTKTHCSAFTECRSDYDLDLYSADDRLLQTVLVDSCPQDDLIDLAESDPSDPTKAARSSMDSEPSSESFAEIIQSRTNLEWLDAENLALLESFIATSSANRGTETENFSIDSTLSTERDCSVTLAENQLPDTDWPTLANEMFIRAVPAGSVGVLTRDSKSVLLISALLDIAGIEHHLKHTNGTRAVDGWIARLLSSLQSGKLTRDRFDDFFSRCYPEINPESYWAALADGRPVKTEYSVADLFTALATASSASMMRSSIGTPIRATVSSISSAAGDQFDHAIVVSEDSIPTASDGHGSASAEHQRTEADVDASLGVSGAVSPDTRVIHLPSQLPALQHLERDTSSTPCPDRYYQVQSRGPHRAALRTFQFLSDIDLDPRSFGSERSQEWIMSMYDTAPGMALELRGDFSGKSPTYHLVDPERPSVRLARVTEHFMRDLTNALGEARNYPDVFCDLRVTRVVSHMGSSDGISLPVATCDRQCVWYGLEVIGMAQVIYDNY